MESKRTVLDLRNVSKTYATRDERITVLRDVTFTLESGTSLALIGPSGSGKSTLLAIAAGLDDPDSGEVTLVDHRLAELSDDERGYLRNRDIGFVYQNFRLIPTLTALENITLPLELLGEVSFKEASERARILLDQVKLFDRRNHLPSALSGGEQQRISLARALINNPKVLFADEPTGNLDRDTASLVVSLMHDLLEHRGTALCVVTHDLELAARQDRTLHLQAGRV